MTTQLQTERHASTLVMKLSGPATRNALSPQVFAAGIEALNMAENDADVHAVILTGEGSHFCGGGDLHRLAHHRTHDVQAASADVDAFHQWIDALRSFPKPVIAAVEGLAAGDGVSLALVCDLLVAAENTRFVMACDQLALSPTGGASWHLSRRLGQARALAMLWLGEHQTAQQWFAHGLVHKVVPAGTALSNALTVTQALARMPTHVLCSVKELVNEAGAQSFNEHLTDEKQHFVRNLVKTEAGHAIDAQLLSKRP